MHFFIAVPPEQRAAELPITVLLIWPTLLKR
jgi:hypothetical protein